MKKSTLQRVGAIMMLSNRSSVFIFEGLVAFMSIESVMSPKESFIKFGTQFDNQFAF